MDLASALQHCQYSHHSWFSKRRAEQDLHATAPRKNCFLLLKRFRCRPSGRHRFLFDAQVGAAGGFSRLQVTLQSSRSMTAHRSQVAMSMVPTSPFISLDRGHGPVDGSMDAKPT